MKQSVKQSKNSQFAVAFALFAFVLSFLFCLLSHTEKKKARD